MCFEAVTSDWWTDVDLEKIKSVWGGEVAADALTDYLIPIKFTLYSKNPPLTFRYLLQIGLTRVPNGNVEVLDKFWQFDPDEKFSPPLLTYADLVASADARNLEVAQIIYDQHLARLIE